MSTVRYRELRLNNTELELLFEGNEINNKINNNTEFGLLNKASQNFIKLSVIPSVFIKTKKLLIDFNSIEFDSDDTAKVFDLVFKDDNKIYKIVESHNVLLDKPIRYMDPIELESGLLGIVFIAGTNELSIFCAGEAEYNSSIYSKVEDYENISNYKVLDNKFSFKLERKIDLDLLQKSELILIERTTREKYSIPIKYINSDDRLEIVADFANFISRFEQIVSRWDFYIEYTYDSYLERKRIVAYTAPVLPSHERYFDSLVHNCQNMFVPYLTTKNELALRIQKKNAILNEKYTSDIRIKKFSMRRNIIKVSVQLEMPDFSGYKLERAVLVFRNKAEQKEIPVDATDKNRKGFKRNIQITIDIDRCELEQLFWDVYIVVNVNGEELYLKVKNPKTLTKNKFTNKLFGNNYTINDEYIVYPYITANNALALTYRNKGKYESRDYKLRELAAYIIYNTFKWYFNRKNIWLIHEKFSETAQDNSFYFFKHCYYNQPDNNVYFVIRKDSPDFQNLKGMEDRVLDFMSIKHLLYLCAAKTLVSSESKTHGYAWRVQQGKIRKILDAKKYVFLQHGVTGLKRVDKVFSKKSKTAADLFVVTSDYEKEIITNNFGYKDDEIITTGFCRWDELTDKSKQLKTKEIFLMPTWRNWLDEVSEEKFVSTPYFKNYMALLNSEKLHKLLIKNNIKLNFYLHPKFKYYIDNFHAHCENINIIQYGEQKVNELLMRTSLLITDYSSVSWDVYYQKKPIIFYQFDIDDYNYYQGSYMDMETELFGDRVFHADDLIKTIEYYVDNNFQERQAFSDSRKKYFKYVDTNNCKRTFDIINSSDILKSPVRDKVKKNKKLTLYRIIRESEFVYNLWNWAKKHNKAFTIAKGLKRVVRKLTIPV